MPAVEDLKIGSTKPSLCQGCIDAKLDTTFPPAALQAGVRPREIPRLNKHIPITARKYLQLVHQGILAFALTPIKQAGELNKEEQSPKWHPQEHLDLDQGRPIHHCTLL